MCFDFVCSFFFYLYFTGINVKLRNAANVVKPTISTISQDDNCVLIKIQTVSHEREIRFILGEEFDEEIYGKMCKVREVILNPY